MTTRATGLDVRRITRGTVVIVRLEPAQGHEQGKTRPAVVVSSDVHNRNLTTIIVVPISGLKGKQPFPHEVFICSGEGGLTEDSVAQPVQIRTVDRNKRVAAVLGQLQSTTMAQIDASLFAVLGGIG